MLHLPVPVPAERAERYRAAGWWDHNTLAGVIGAAALERPNGLAVADDDRQLTWSELQQAIAGAAAALDAAGVEAGDALVLVTGNTVDGVVAIHAALQLGATILVLDRRVGPADVRFALDALPDRARVLLPEAERERLDSHGTDILLLEQVARASGTFRGPEPDRDAASLVLFTSGSTGRPKGVVHSHNTLAAGAANMVIITGCTDDDVIFLVSPLTSITGVQQLFLSADRHAAFVLTDRFDADRTLDRLEEVGGTILGGPPVILERLLEAAARRGLHRVPLRSLGLGGTMLPRPVLELATSGFGIRISRVYGSSEAPNFSGSTPDDDPEQRLADDGALLLGGEVRVGSSGHPQEGLLRGPCLFLGYLDPDDNLAAFEDGWFRTGDLIEVHDGRVTVVGRIKEVVVRNGLKVSPAEIDLALAGMPGVSEHACFGRPDLTTGERLAVAVRPAEGANVTLNAVIEHLLAAGVARRKLPEELVLWDEPLPRTTTEKVIRSQLVHDADGRPSEVAERLRSEP